MAINYLPLSKIGGSNTEIPSRAKGVAWKDVLCQKCDKI